MQVRVLFFASFRDAAGVPRCELELQAGARLGDARAALGERFPALRSRLEHVRFAVDQEFASADAPLRDGSEVAVIPPVSGG